ncbi:MAG: DNA translocase FtsK 4TM domain-containing protein [bacterium]|nr:DNA translocase FtsK 4TM domain-containing protein [bacterium]
MSKKIKTFNKVGEVKKETWQAVISIIFFVVALLAILASFGKAGFVGQYLYDILKKLLGIGYFLLPIALAMVGVSFLKGAQKKFEISKMVGAIMFFVSGLGLIDLLIVHEGGILGRYISWPLISLFDVYAAATLLIAILTISILITFNIHFTLENLMFWRLFRREKKEYEEEDISEEETDEYPEYETPGEPDEDEGVAKAIKEVEKKIIKNDEKETESFTPFISTRSTKPFVPPPLSLLEKDKGKPETGDIKANANIIKRTLQNFGINVEMDEISIGPSVTRYALKPAEGVKLSKIIALNNDLALALAAHPIRIEAPIPGKSLVGVEIPNTTKTTVGLATILGSEEYQQSEKPLLISLGKGISGKPLFANLAKAPHMLIAGATGSGKSVTIHAVIASLLFRNSPEDLKFIMIDPKRVELTLYNKIPHLLTPVITEPKKAILALKWAAKEMSRRYDILEKNSMRDIDSYHKNKDPEAESMPYIVIVLDELADIMQSYPRELESAIVRLAQMSRAVGIHLILSTQRPSVNVITGLIKANIPTRVALQVSSQIDSRTILDGSGAEKLLGAGDMLYQGGEMSKPQRLQSAYISESEVKKVAKYLADTYKDEIMGEINLTPPEAGKDSIFEADLEEEDIGEEDDMYEQARETVIESGKASTSYLQRKLGVGYSRAARLMDMLEQKGVIGPANGSKARDVFGSQTDGDGPQISDNTEDEIGNAEKTF